jgi:hypothetical protein
VASEGFGVTARLAGSIPGLIDAGAPAAAAAFSPIPRACAVRSHYD